MVQGMFYVLFPINWIASRPSLEKTVVYVTIEKIAVCS